jgi:apolipoprotein N-acyltransferase
VQVSPTGFSAFVDPDGTVHDRTAVSEQAVIVRDIALRDGSTWYVRLGEHPWVLAMIVLLGLSWAGATGRLGRATTR